jgi:hypothetical protein
MLFVVSTTMTAGVELVTGQFPMMIEQGRQLIDAGSESAGRQKVLTGYLNIALALFVMATVGGLTLTAAARWVGVLGGLIPARLPAPTPPANTPFPAERVGTGGHGIELPKSP